MKNGFLDLENVCNEEITKIHKTQSAVPSKSSKHGSSVKLWKMDSLTSTYVMKKLRKSIRPNPQYPSGPSKPGSWPGFSKSSKHGSSEKLWKMDSLTPKTYVMKEITKIHKTQSSVPFKDLQNRKLTWIFEVIQTWVAPWNYEKWIPWPRKRI